MMAVKLYQALGQEWVPPTKETAEVFTEEAALYYLATCTHVGKIPIPHSLFLSAAVLTRLCFPSSPTSTLSGDTLSFSCTEKIVIIRRKRSQCLSFSACNAHPSLPLGLMSHGELQPPCWAQALVSHYKGAGPSTLSLHR